MFQRSIKLFKSNSFFLFGARGTGKSTLLRESLGGARTLWVDLLDPDTEDRLNRNPGALLEIIRAQKKGFDWVVIDEVQKNVKLLDLVHQQIETKRLKFAMTGSSARKLKRGAANLLAGRAFVSHLYPLTLHELGKKFDLASVLQFGSLPKIFQLESVEEKKEFLRTYSLTYMKEEVWGEQLIKNMPPFRRFLEIAAQRNGQIVNATNIARDIGADPKTVQNYFDVLEDTLLGFHLDPFNSSIRKRLSQKPKFYFFDLGIKRALDRTLNVELVPGTYAYGKAFEHLLIVEAFRMNDYLRKDYRFSYMRTKDDAEIDLIIERPGIKRAAIEIKSTLRISNLDARTRSFAKLVMDLKNTDGYLLSQDPLERKVDGIWCLPWQKGMVELGLM